MPPCPIGAEAGDVRGRASGIASETDRGHLGVLGGAPWGGPTYRRVVSHAVGGGGKHSSRTHKHAPNPPTTVGALGHLGSTFEPATIALGAEFRVSGGFVPHLKMGLGEVRHG